MLGGANRYGFLALHHRRSDNKLSVSRGNFNQVTLL
jgi:hypothetical protein